MKLDRKKYSALVAIGAFLQFLPYRAFAQLPKIPCPQGLRCPTGMDNTYGIASINGFIYTIITWLLGIAFSLTVLFLIIGGFRFVVSGGNEESAEAGKRTIVNALIGIVVIILSYVIISALVNVVGTANFGASTGP